MGNACACVATGERRLLKTVAVELNGCRLRPPQGGGVWAELAFASNATTFLSLKFARDRRRTAVRRAANQYANIAARFLSASPEVMHALTP